MQALLRKRENELQKLLKQMKDDKLSNSTLFKNLEEELDTVKSKRLIQKEH
ncbi:MAG TPA: hypothetical protein VD927_13550 [Chryseosolibacter sp.]|nr:hypothetical protein [Chryseosolibacter sp.]